MDKIELIVQYFTKNLSPEAQKEFDYLKETDANFAKQVDFQENLKTVIRTEEQNTVKQQLQGFEAEENSRFDYRKWSIAATITVLLGLSGFWYLNKSMNTEKLFLEYFQPYRNVVQPLLRSETKTDTKTKAFTAYEARNYEQALQYFDQILKTNPNETIAFYKANVLLKLDKTEEAVSILKNNLKTKDSLDAKNNWYLALAQLRLNNADDAKALLKKLDTSSVFKNKNVKQLLKKIK